MRLFRIQIRTKHGPERQLRPVFLPPSICTRAHRNAAPSDTHSSDRIQKRTILWGAELSGAHSSGKIQKRARRSWRSGVHVLLHFSGKKRLHFPRRNDRIQILCRSCTSMQDSYIGSTAASQAAEAGSTPVSCSIKLNQNRYQREKPRSFNDFRAFLRPIFEVGKKDIKKGFGKFDGPVPLPTAF